MYLAMSQPLSLKTIVGYPCSHSYTGSHPERSMCVCVEACEGACTHPGICDHLRASIKKSVRSFLRIQRSSVKLVNFSDTPPRHPWGCLPEIHLKSFLLMRGTIKLSNGHKHYVKGGVYCQQFEHCLLPGSADEMSGAQYFKAINLSAFLFSLITF